MMRKFKIIIAFAGVGLILQSCLVAKDYTAPENIVESEAFRNGNSANDTASIAYISWGEMFSDPMLQNLINRALTNNIDMQVAVKQIEIAEAYIKQGKAAYLPSVNAGLNYNLYALSENGPQGSAFASGATNPFQLFDISLNVSWEADIWGKIRSQKRAYEASYYQNIAVTQAIQSRLVSSLATAYYQLLALDKKIQIVQESLALRQSSFETAEALKNAGVGGITSIAVQQTKAQTIEAQVLLVELEKQTHLIENLICILMGDEPHAIERSSLDNQTTITELKTGVPMQLLANRPDVMVAEFNYRRSFEMTNVSRASLYPSLTIGLGGGIQSARIDNWFSLNSLLGNVMTGIMAPIFNQRKLKTNYEVSQIQQEQARLNYRGTLLQASKEVSDAILMYQASLDKIELQQEQEELLNAAVVDAKALLQSGYNNFSYLEVLTAQQNALNIQMSVVDTKATELMSIVELYRALGGGVR